MKVVSPEYYDGIVKKLPGVVRIEPASICNLKCMPCPTSLAKKSNHGVMSLKTFETILREAKFLKPRVVVFYHGGEPFLNKNIFHMIEQIKSVGIGFIKTVTNGMLLKEKMLSKIIESGLDSIEFSLDGTSPEENDEIRKGCDYKKVSSSIKRLIDIKRTLNSDKPKIFISNCQIPADELQIEQGKPEIADYIARDFSQYDKSEIEFKTCFAIYWPGFPVDTSKYMLSRPYSNKKAVNYCEHPMELITIRHNGDVVACCYDITGAYILGNVKQTSIKEIWNNKKYRALRKSIHGRKYLPLCENCNVVKPWRFLIRKEG